MAPPRSDGHAHGVLLQLMLRGFDVWIVALEV
jgi:hypothetical protein